MERAQGFFDAVIEAVGQESPNCQRRILQQLRLLQDELARAWLLALAHIVNSNSQLETEMQKNFDVTTPEGQRAEIDQLERDLRLAEELGQSKNIAVLLRAVARVKKAYERKYKPER